MTEVLPRAHIVALHFQILESKFDGVSTFDPAQTLVEIKIVLGVITYRPVSIGSQAVDVHTGEEPVLVHTFEADLGRPSKILRRWT